MPLNPAEGREGFVSLGIPQGSDHQASLAAFRLHRCGVLLMIAAVELFGPGRDSAGIVWGRLLGLFPSIS